MGPARAIYQTGVSKSRFFSHRDEDLLLIKGRHWHPDSKAGGSQGHNSLYISLARIISMQLNTQTLSQSIIKQIHNATLKKVVVWESEREGRSRWRAFLSSMEMSLSEGGSV